MIALGTKLGLTAADSNSSDAWYAIEPAAFEAIGGKALLSKYRGSMWRMLSAVFPERDWMAFRFGRVPPGYWSSSIKHQRDFLEFIAPHLGLKKGEPDGWYQVNLSKLNALGGGGIVDLYGKSLSKLLATVFPEHPWDPSKFSSKPRNYWKSLENQKKLVDDLGERLGVTELDGWYDISVTKLIPLGAGSLLQHYNGSLLRLLYAVYPDHPWDPSKFAAKQRNYWTSIETQRNFMDGLGEKLGLRSLDDWYGVSTSQLLPLGADTLLLQYERSLSKLLNSVYPHHPWDLSKFSTKHRNYWSSIENQRKFMDDLGVKLGVRSLDDWYSIRMTQLIPLGAVTVLSRYGRSLSNLLAAVYPAHPWDPSKFSIKPHDYWSSVDNQRKFMDDLGKKIGVNSDADLEKWYEQSVQLLAANGGWRVAALYRNSLPKLLSAMYPHYDWQLWKFPGRIGKVLKSEVELGKLFTFLESSLEIREPQDWYRVTSEQLAALKVPSFYRSTPGGLVSLLSKRYPNIEWDASAFFGRGYRRASQKWLATMLAGILPLDTMLTDYSHIDLLRGSGEKEFQLDIYFPELRLAFEYQGAQHYEQLRVYGDSRKRMESDVDKAVLCKRHGITLIAVPFWWNRKRPALLAALLAERPDLFAAKLAPYLEEAQRGQGSGPS